MKRVIALMLCALLCAGAFATAETGCNQMGLAALQSLWDGKSNCFVSPVSLGLALEMAGAGAGGQTLIEIEALLEKDDLHGLTIPGLKSADAAFVREEAIILDGYKESLEGFGAALFPLDDLGRVNAWVKEHTDGLIEKLTDALPGDTALMLLSALAMDARWAQPFNSHFTRPELFHGPLGDGYVYMMHDTFTTDYAELDNQQFLKLYYEDSSLYMLLMLPGDGDANSSLNWLKENKLNAIPFEMESAERIVSDIIENERRYGNEPDEDALKMIREWFDEPMPWQVSVSLPKMDILSVCELSGALKAQGMEAAFDKDRADFSGISDIPLYITNIGQRVRVQVDELGTRAAAVTEISYAAGESLYEQIPVSFRCDRPFVMLIADEDSGSICFAGVVTKPDA
ncbi:MAG: hypothetical protein IJU28_07990 [Clostridia bacterium]|nr:hypothetical protein [Clostridia bacterium]